MIASAHVAAGALVGVIATRAWSAGTAVCIAIAILLGLGSHMVMDAIPHSEYMFMSLDHAVQVAIVEAILACGIVWLVLRRRVGRESILPVVAGIVAAMLPDLQFVSQVTALPAATELSNAGDVFHILHANTKAPPNAGAIGELALAALLLFVAARFAWRRGEPTPIKAEATPS
ncbi:MAG: hypothetical protein P3A28_05910 [Gemmatimonadota bacterium]|nr:hypothetical protein [Gemmatimonadota bacterium]